MAGVSGGNEQSKTLFAFAKKHAETGVEKMQVQSGNSKDTN